MNAAAPDIPQALGRALALLNAGPWHPLRVRAYVITGDSRYCALTLDNYESYIVDLEAGRHLHYPEAGVTGVRGNVVVLSPDDKRFNIEGWFVDDLEVDLGAPDRPWQEAEAHTAASVLTSVSNSTGFTRCASKPDLNAFFLSSG